MAQESAGRDRPPLPASFTDRGAGWDTPPAQRTARAGASQFGLLSGFPQFADPLRGLELCFQYLFGLMKAGAMPITPLGQRRIPLMILVVGSSVYGSAAVLARAERYGCPSHVVETLGEARSLLATLRFDIVLAKEYLPDGSSYALIPALEDMAGSLYVAVALSDSCLWLPAVEEGVRCLGETALNPGVFLGAMEKVLRFSGDAANKEKANEIPGPRPPSVPYIGPSQHSLGARRAGRPDRMPARSV